MIAAPMTSSDDLPAGISCAVTCSSACALFQALTTCLPQLISCAVLEYQMVIGPRAAAASLPPPPLSEPQALTTSAAASTVAAKPRVPGRDESFMGVPFLIGAVLSWWDCVAVLRW